MKKTLAFLLAFVMLFSLGITANAAEKKELNIYGSRNALTRDFEELIDTVDELHDRSGERLLDFPDVKAESPAHGDRKTQGRDDLSYVVHRRVPPFYCCSIVYHKNKRAVK